jgi:hypothetical protein
LSKCAAITRAGAPCKGVAIGSSEWCPAHHPEYADARRRRASKGGKRGGRGRPLLEVQGIAGQLQELVDKVLTGELDRGDAAVCGQLLNYKTRALDVVRAWRETEELAREVEEMREVLERSREYGA